MTTYDVTFNTVDGKSLIKRNVQSDHENARVWEDAVERFDADHLYIKMNDKTMVSLLRRAVVRLPQQEAAAYRRGRAAARCAVHDGARRAPAARPDAQLGHGRARGAVAGHDVDGRGVPGGCAAGRLPQATP